MVNIQIISDLHLEFRGHNFKKLIKPSAPILCLLGDICSCGTNDDWNVYTSFIKYISPQFKHIIHIPGNHEYYSYNKVINANNTICSIDKKIRKFSKTIPNMYFLNNNTISITLDKKKYVFIGTTLWSGVEPNAKKYVEDTMNDYESIYYTNEKPKTELEKNKWSPVRKFNINDMSKLHIKSVKYINSELTKTNPSDNVIILTHHKIYRSRPLSNFISHAYETDLFPKIIKPQPNLKLLAYGHTHVKDDILISNTRVVSNPKGYINQHTKFDDSFTVNI
jgi:predicted phosphodiesterase